MKSPPIIGAAIRFITSAPVPMDHMIGTSPRKVVAKVVAFCRFHSKSSAKRMLCRRCQVKVGGSHDDSPVAGHEVRSGFRKVWF